MAILKLSSLVKAKELSISVEQLLITRIGENMKMLVLVHQAVLSSDWLLQYFCLVFSYCIIFWILIGYYKITYHVIGYSNISCLVIGYYDISCLVIGNCDILSKSLSPKCILFWSLCFILLVCCKISPNGGSVLSCAVTVGQGV